MYESSSYTWNNKARVYLDTTKNYLKTKHSIYYIETQGLREFDYILHIGVGTGGCLGTETNILLGDGDKL